MNPAAPDETEWVERARNGDQRAFAELVRRYQDRIFRFVLRMTGSRDEALDAVQETFMKAWQALPGWRPEAKLSTWLFRIARNTALDALRREKHGEHVPIEEELSLADAGPGPESRLDTKQRFGALDTALRRLPLEHREILLLREVEEMSYGDIAAALSISEGTVKSRLARARTALLEKYRRVEKAHG